MDEEEKKFLEWYSKSDVLPDTVKIDEFEIPGRHLEPEDPQEESVSAPKYRGLRILKPLEENDVVFRVPIELCIYPRTAHCVLVHEVFSLDAEGLMERFGVPECFCQLLLDPYIQMLLILFYEKVHLQDSFWRPYFALMPGDFGMPLAWPFDERMRHAELFVRHPSLIELGAEHARLWRNVRTFYHDFVMPCLFRHLAEYFPPDQCELADFEWSNLIIWSRAFWYDDEQSMPLVVPYVDMANFPSARRDTMVSYQFPILHRRRRHEDWVPVEEAEEKEKEKEKEKEEKEFFVVRTIIPYQPGDEFVLDYGMKCDADFLLYYGFVFLGNASTKLQLCLPDAQASALNPYLERTLLLGLYEGDLPLFALGYLRFPFHLLNFMRLFQLSYADIGAFTRALSLPTLNSRHLYVHTENEAQAWALAEAFCVEWLAARVALDAAVTQPQLRALLANERELLAALARAFRAVRAFVLRLGMPHWRPEGLFDGEPFGSPPPPRGNPLLDREREEPVEVTFVLEQAEESVGDLADLVLVPFRTQGGAGQAERQEQEEEEEEEEEEDEPVELPMLVRVNELFSETPRVQVGGVVLVLGMEERGGVVGISLLNAPSDIFIFWPKSYSFLK